MTRKTALSLAFAATVLTPGLAAEAAEAPTVVTSIKPLHSLVASIMKGAGAPHLIVKGGGSPHSYSLKPSDAAALQKAKVVFWVGEELEVFLEETIETIASDAKVVALADAQGVSLLPFREGGPWAEHEDHGEHAHEEHEEHEHHEHGEHAHEKHEEHAHEEHAEHAHEKHEEHAHEEHAEHAHEKHEEHGHEGHAHEEHAEHGHDEHAHGEFDMHIWLDPENAKIMAAAAAKALIEADPANGDLYRANKANLDQRLEALGAEITAELAAVKDAPFIVFHDAYQYMEQRFDLNTVGSITVSPERQPGAARLREIHEKIGELNARCVFAEPQFEPRLVRTVVEGTAAKTGILDPLGADLKDGPDLYFELMRRNAESLRNCLGESS